MQIRKPPAFQFYAADYLADEHVQLMTLEEEGVYIRLLAYCWREGSIPADPQALSRLCKGAPHEAVLVVRDCFEPMPGNSSRLTHARLNVEREKQENWREKSIAGGVRSGKARRVNKLRVEPPFNQTAKLVEPNTNSSFASSSSSAKEKECASRTREPERLAEPLEEDAAGFDASDLVAKIVCAHPKSRLRSLRPSEVSQAQAVAVLDAMAAEIDAGATAADALAMMLARTQLLADKVPRSEWRFFKDPAQFFRNRDYRLEPADFTGGRHGTKSSSAAEREERNRRATYEAAAELGWLDAGDAHGAVEAPLASSGNFEGADQERPARLVDPGG